MAGIDMKRYIKAIAAHQQAVNPVAFSEENSDYLEDGLIVCGKCKQKKQSRIPIAGEIMVVPCLCKCRSDELKERDRKMQEEENLTRIKSLRTESLMPGKYEHATFDRYIKMPGNERAYKVAKNYVEKFEEMRRMNQGLLFCGPCGTGKSYTAACIANELLNQMHSVIMTSFVKLLQDFRSDEAETRFMDALRIATLVIIDDLGAERGTDYAVEKVYNVVDTRIRAGKPLILTTNLTQAEIDDPQDIRYKRIYDRIAEACYTVELTGKSMRQMQANARKEKMRKLLEEG